MKKKKKKKVTKTIYILFLESIFLLYAMSMRTISASVNEKNSKLALPTGKDLSLSVISQ